MSNALKSPIHSDSLADVLERVLDKGVVIAGDVVVSLVGIELLSIKVRLLITTVDKAIEMGINWWEMDPSLSVAARDAERAIEGGGAPAFSSGPALGAAAGLGPAAGLSAASGLSRPAASSPAAGVDFAALEEDRRRLEETNRELRGRLAMLERRISGLEK